jgi:hypothetical protein
MVGDLGRYLGRWPAFSRAGLEAGVHAVFSFPLQAGGVRLGVLEVYSAEVRLLDEAEEALALAFCHEALLILFAAGSPAPDGTWEALPDGRAEIYQAQGMVMVDLGVDLEEALLRMRAHSFSEGLSLTELAQAIIAGFVLPPAAADPR